MSATQEQMKQQAIKYLKDLGIYTPYIDGFVKEDKVCFFEQFGGYWVYQEHEIEAKMKEIEKRYNAKCYAITHEYTSFGECWDFLLVTDEPEEWEDLYECSHNEKYAFAYVYNKDDDDCSELGSIVVKSAFGGITRIG